MIPAPKKKVVKKLLKFRMAAKSYYMAKSSDKNEAIIEFKDSWNITPVSKDAKNISSISKGKSIFPQNGYLAPYYSQTRSQLRKNDPKEVLLSLWRRWSGKTDWGLVAGTALSRLIMATFVAFVY